MRVKLNDDNKKKCVCINCPSYDECMRGGKEILYCANNKSSCSFKRKGCICGSCPVHEENDLKFGYYCNSGAKE